jgi:hypothetical protein
VGVIVILLTIPFFSRGWSWIGTALIALAIVAQISQFTLGLLSHRSAEERQRISNREYASILYAIAHRNADLSKIIEKLKTGGEYRNDYVLGYLAFNEARFDDTRIHLSNGTPAMELL